SEAKSPGISVFPGGRPQVTQCRLALTGVELGHLPELQLIALAGAAREVIQNSATYTLDPAGAARLCQFEIVDRPVRREQNAIGGWCGGHRLLARQNRKAGRQVWKSSRSRNSLMANLPFEPEW